MSLLRPRVRDDRGRWVRLGVAAFERGASPLKVCVAVGLLVVLVLAALLVGADVLHAAWLAWRGPTTFREWEEATFVSGYTPWVLLAWGCILGGVLLQARAWRLKGYAALRWDGACGACGYDLCNTRKREDGCRVCPICGAAWRLPEWSRARDRAEQGESEHLVESAQRR